MTRRIRSKRHGGAMVCGSCHRPATDLTLTDVGSPTGEPRLVCGQCLARAGQTDARFARKNQRQRGKRGDTTA
jgi:hypothetical protein